MYLTKKISKNKAFKLSDERLASLPTWAEYNKETHLYDVFYRDEIGEINFFSSYSSIEKIKEDFDIRRS